MSVQHYGVLQQVGPASEPVTLTELKNYLKVDVNDDDDYITGLGIAARELLEAYSSRQFVQATWLWTLDSFAGYPVPGGQILLGHRPVPQQRGGGWYWPTYTPILKPPRSPLISVSSIQYVDPTSPLNPVTYTTLAASAYQVDTISQPGRILPQYGTVWPVTLEVPNAVKITFVAGYSTVPERVKLIIKMLVGPWYQRREDYETAASRELPVGLRILMSSIHAGWYR